MSNGINVNPLNAITQVYLDQIANAKTKETQKDIERWTQEGYQRDPEQSKKDRTHSSQPDPSKDGFTGIGNMSIDDIRKMNAKIKAKEAAKKKVSEDAKYGYDKDGNSLNPKDKKKQRWQDDDVDGKWYEKSDVDGKISKREKEEKKKKEEEEIDESRLVKKVTRPLRKAKKVVKRVEKWFDDDPGRAHTMGTLGNPHMRNDEKRAAERKAGKKKIKEHHSKDCDDNCEPNCEHDKAIEEGYGKIKTPEKVVAKVRVKKGPKPPIGSKVRVKNESFSDWRTDLREIMIDDEDQKEIKEKNVKNKITINPKLGEAIEEIGGEVLEAYIVTRADIKGNTPAAQGLKAGKKNVKTGKPLYKAADHLKNEVEYDNLDNDLLQFIESSLGNLPEDQILDLVESMWHRRNPGKKHPLESGSSKVKRRPVSDAEKKSTDKSDRMYVAMRRVKDRQKGYDRDKADAADRLHSTYTDRQSRRKKGASAKEASAQSHGEFGSKGFRIKRGGRSGKAPATDRGTGNKARRRAGQEVKDKGYQKGMVGNDPKGYRK